MAVYKKIYDPVHGFIRFSPLEKQLIDSVVFQRLHYIHQLGAAYLVYPGATHTRFSHSIGVMEVATRIFDKLLEFHPEYEQQHPVAYWRQIVRLAALCHDLGHLPFSHLAEKRILGHLGHEEWTLSCIKSPFLAPIWNEVQREFPAQEVADDLIKVSIGQKKLSMDFSPWEYVMSQIITGDFFGADRIDYLLRDARCTGVSYGLFDYQQLIEMLRILPCEATVLTLGVEENGIASCEALLLARHFMHNRVYQYPSVQAYSFHMARFMEKLYREQGALDSLAQYLSYTDNEVLSRLRLAFAEGAEDALAIFSKKTRYKAIALPAHISEEAILSWRTRHSIPPALAEFVSCKKQEPIPSFSVLQKGKVVDSSRCSQLHLQDISYNWLYVAPQCRTFVEELCSVN